MDVIQQWQYNGAVHPEMLTDSAFSVAKDCGITALQSYVPWSNIEPHRGKFDFSLYDPLVEKILEHGLDWVPFLILGPHYATPEWFLKSDESVFSRCLEHAEACRIQSIWNPHLRKYVDGFIEAFSRHYRHSGSVRSVLLGIGGNWGESIFPVSGGFTEERHMHMGWWCGDTYALSHFRNSQMHKYADIDSLNSAWGSNYRSFEELDFPKQDKRASALHLLHMLGYRFLGWLPKRVRSALKSVAGSNTGLKEIGGDLRQWLDFARWYTTSMTEWVSFWLATARTHFPDEPLYIVTGGDGHPMMGADFFAQTKEAARFSAGIRVTSLCDNYPDSFVLSRPVASAAKFYGTYFETEEAGLHKPEGIPMRIFDAVTSGARGVYFKNLVGYGNDLCTGKYYPPGERTMCADIFAKCSNLLKTEIPAVTIAVLYPSSSILLEPHVLGMLKDRSASLRHHLDFDFVDETMLRDGALEKYTTLISLVDSYLTGESENAILSWVKQTGRLYVRVVGNVEGAPVEEKGSGHIVRIRSSGNLTSAVSSAVTNPGGKYPWEGRYAMANMPAGVFGAKCADGTYAYNASKKGRMLSMNGKRQSLSPHSISRSEGPHAVCKS